MAGSVSLGVSLLLTAMVVGAAQSPATTRVVGRVIDAKTRETLAGATVILQPVNRGAQPTPPSSFNALTDESGVFSVDALPGQYLVVVSHSGFVRSNLRNPSTHWISGRTVNLGDIRLQRGGAIEGRLFDANGSPMPRVSVSVVPPGLNILRRNEVGSQIGSALTNDLGAFRVASVPAGKYYVVAQPAPRPLFNRQAVVDATFVNTYYPGSASPAAARLVEVVAGSTTNGIEFRLMESATVTVSGVVVDKKPGWPVPEARVTFLPQGDRLARPVMTTAQADGTFTVALPDGKYRVEASRPIVVSQTANSRSVRYERGSRSVNVKVEGRPVNGLRVVADR